MQKIQNFAVGKDRFKIASTHPILEADVDTSAFVSSDKIPELRLRLGENIDRSRAPRMNLERERVGRIQDLYQNRKTKGIVAFTENFLSIVSPDFVQRSPTKFGLGNDALCIFAIHQFPGFPNRVLAREHAVEVGLKFSTAPYSFHIQRFKRQAVELHICV